MWPNPQFPTDLVTFTEEFLNGKCHFCAVASWLFISSLIMFSFTVYLVFSLVFKYLLLSHFRIRRYANEQPLFPTLLLTISLNMIYQFPNSCFIKKYFFHYFKKFSIFPFCHFYADIWKKAVFIYVVLGLMLFHL